MPRQQNAQRHQKLNDATFAGVLRGLGSIFSSVYAAIHKLKKKVYKAGKRLLYVKRNKAISLKNTTSKVGIEVQQLFLKGLYLDFQDSPDDEEDTRRSQEYMNDLEEEYQARALLAKSKKFFEKGTQRFSNAKVTDQTECHKCGKKDHFSRDYWSKTSVPLYQSTFQPKILHSSDQKPKPRHTKDFEAKYNKVKAKLALLKEVSPDENEITEVKALMALADEERVSVGKASARNGEWIKISMKKHVNTKILKEIQNFINELKELTSITKAWLNSSNKVIQLDNSEVSITVSNKPKLSEAEDSTLSNHDTGKHPLPPLEKLTGAEFDSGSKTIK
ncbi:hypothetical protein Tco_0169720 [Tanacetum coccineum]